MKITNVKIKRVSGNGPLKGIATITFDNEIAMHDVKIIIADNDKKFLTMPNNNNKRLGVYQDIVHPISSKFRKYLENTVFEFYYTDLIKDNSFRK